VGTRAILLVVLEANNGIDNSAPLLNHGSSRVFKGDWPILFSAARASGRVHFITSFTFAFTAASNIAFFTTAFTVITIIVGIEVFRNNL
jgi:hypothetical protein